MPFYKVQSRQAETGDGIPRIVPDVDCRCRVIRPLRDDDCFIVQTESAPSSYIEEVGEDDPVVTSHLDWWAAHPEAESPWTEVY